MMKIQQMKERVRDFVAGLPGGDTSKSEESPRYGFAAMGKAPSTPKKEKAAPAVDTKVRAPQAVFIGREAELGALKEAVAEGGAFVLHGPEGVGKKWLVSQAFSGDDGPRLVTRVCLEQGAAFDTLASRLGEWRGGEAMVVINGDERPIPRKAASALAAALT